MKTLITQKDKDEYIEGFKGMTSAFIIAVIFAIGLGVCIILPMYAWMLFSGIPAFFIGIIPWAGSTAFLLYTYAWFVKCVLSKFKPTWFHL